MLGFCKKTEVFVFFSIHSKPRNDFVSLDCISENKKCWHGCQDKIKAAESDLLKSSIFSSIDKLSLDKLVHFKDENGIVHALCWIQALNGRKSCLECESELVKFKQKISMDTSESGWKSNFTYKRVGLAALAVFALLLLTTAKSANFDHSILDTTSNFYTYGKTYLWNEKCSENFGYTICHRIELMECILSEGRSLQIHLLPEYKLLY